LSLKSTSCRLWFVCLVAWISATSACIRFVQQPEGEIPTGSRQHLIPALVLHEATPSAHVGKSKWRKTQRNRVSCQMVPFGMSRARLCTRRRAEWAAHIVVPGTVRALSAHLGGSGRPAATLSPKTSKPCWSRTRGWSGGGRAGGPGGFLDKRSVKSDPSKIGKWGKKKHKTRGKH